MAQKPVMLPCLFRHSRGSFFGRIFLRCQNGFILLCGNLLPVIHVKQFLHLRVIIEHIASCRINFLKRMPQERPCLDTKQFRPGDFLRIDIALCGKIEEIGIPANRAGAEGNCRCIPRTTDIPGPCYR